MNGRLYDFVEEPQAMGFCLGKGILESSDLKLSPGELEMEKLPRAWLVGTPPCDHLGAHGEEQFAKGQHQG